MNRRTVLKNAGLAALAALPGACSGRSEPNGSAVVPRRRARLDLTPVRVSRDLITRTVVGLRPFRPPGFRVERDKLGRKDIVHNYGHGGGGITLSWGSAHLAVEMLFEGTAPTKVAVLGAGALGLSTARLLQERGVEVTIYAKEIPPHTTSNVAAGQWSPYSVADFSRRTEAFEAQFDRAARFSHRYFQNLIGPHYGVRWIPNYVLSEVPFGPADTGPVARLFADSRELIPAEHPFPVPYVRQFVTMLIEPSTYLAAVMRDFQLAGGRVVVKEFPTVHTIVSLKEASIVNCTGLGAKALFADEELTPVKGQLTFLLPQPEVDYITLFGDLYMMPRSDGVLLGGTHERGDWSLEPDMAALDRIVTGHERFFASMGALKST